MKKRFDNWIFTSFPISAEALAICRIMYAVYLLFFVIRRVDWVADFPQVFFKPPLSFARFFSDFPPHGFFYVINVLVILLLVMMLVGYRTRLASIGWTVVLLVYSTFAHSLGKIDHMVLFMVTPLVMSFSNWGAAFSMDAAAGRTSRQVQIWPLTVLALLIGFTMFTSGVWKASSSWLDLSSQAIQSKLIHNFFARDRADLLAPFFLNLEASWFWEVLDWAIVAFEILFIAVVFFPRLFRLWVYFAVLFHFMVLLMLNIDFSIHMIVFLPFFPWGTLKKMLGQRLVPIGNKVESFMGKLRWWMVLPVAVGFVVLLFYHGSLFSWLLHLTGWEAPYFIGLLFLGGGVLIWTLLGGVGIRDFLRERRTDS